jgi:hypothetical protein
MSGGEGERGPIGPSDLCQGGRGTRPDRAECLISGLEGNEVVLLSKARALLGPRLLVTTMQFKLVAFTEDDGVRIVHN